MFIWGVPVSKTGRSGECEQHRRISLLNHTETICEILLSVLINHRSGYSESVYRFIKINNPFVGDNISGPDWLAEYNTLQSTASAEGHIKLTVFEGATRQINNNLIESFSLTFVNGDSPCELQRELRK